MNKFIIRNDFDIIKPKLIYFGIQKEIEYPRVFKMNFPLNNILKTGRIWVKENFTDFIEEVNNGEGYVYGQVGFPDDFDTCMKNITHAITNAELHENHLTLTAKILKTKQAEDLPKYIDNFVLAPRAVGTVNNETKVVKTKRVFTFDLIIKDYSSF